MSHGKVVWITGLAGAGKTALCVALQARLRSRLPQLVVLDGDRVREVFGGDLGYGTADRVTQVRRVQAIARLLAEQGLVVLAAVLYGTSELWAWNRAHLPGYFEVYLRAGTATLRQRRELYRRAEQGLETQVVGVDIAWEPPRNPDLVLDGDGVLDPAGLAERVLSAAPGLAELAGGGLA